PPRNNGSRARIAPADEAGLRAQRPRPARMAAHVALPPARSSARNFLLPHAGSSRPPPGEGHGRCGSDGPLVPPALELAKLKNSALPPDTAAGLPAGLSREFVSVDNIPQRRASKVPSRGAK